MKHSIFSSSLVNTRVDAVWLDLLVVWAAQNHSHLLYPLDASLLPAPSNVLIHLGCPEAFLGL